MQCKQIVHATERWQWQSFYTIVNTCDTKIAMLLSTVRSLQDTIVTDPFYVHMPQHFEMSFPDLLAAKHPTTWIRFERGEISHEEALRDFFQDGRHVDSAKLEAFMVCSHTRKLQYCVAGRIFSVNARLSMPSCFLAKACSAFVSDVSQEQVL
jgi:hypothetical protein